MILDTKANDKSASPNGFTNSQALNSEFSQTFKPIIMNLFVYFMSVFSEKLGLKKKS